MTFKTWLKKIKKKLDIKRPNKYYEALALWFYRKQIRAQRNITAKMKDYPHYVYELFLYALRNTRMHCIVNDFEELKREIRSLDKQIAEYNRGLDNVIRIVENDLPKMRKVYDFNKVRFVKVTNCLNESFIGFLVYHQDRGNGVDYKVTGKFYDINGISADIETIDKTWVMLPMTEEKELDRFLNLYQKEITKMTIAGQDKEFKTLYTTWDIQKTYLTQKAHEEGNAYL
jgi:hypothetical protein